ncbi:MAG: ATP-dependent DNA helicase [Clostridia bacterium]|nr:ATP-dependent DNA helicase [Lachnospiraceae bacterium]NCB99797.1 ATP-dependent DNA helicase [Clostridia bacterium]NCD01944.1 ATP-dependent DNA helicase [Clostridia bacterium]
MKREVRISVRNLVEFILKNGDIDQRMGVMQDVDAMQAGSRAHRKLQKQGGSNYQAEVSLKRKVSIDETLDIQVEGRADGIILNPLNEETVTVDEIKGTFTSLESIEEPDILHIAQADCYACIYGELHGLSGIKVRITYIHLETEEIKIFEFERQREELESWFQDLVSRYAKWAKWQIEWQDLRDMTIEEMGFPFAYRLSQKRMMNGVLRSIDEGKNIFIQAPTGTGKTLGTLFPAIKAMGEKKCGRIFYLTAKTIARTVAEETGKLLSGQGLRMKFVTLTAKEKLCPMDECRCQPEYCERAKGHFDRVNDAVFDMIHREDSMEREKILSYAEQHQVCPFEFQLDVSLWCDVIICDYNYVFDPVVYLKRFFTDASPNMVFLVDEAHNLVERAREMYSAQLYRREFDSLHRQLKTLRPKLAKKVHKCSQFFKDFEESRMAESGSYLKVTEVGSFVLNLMGMVGDMETYLREDMEAELREKVTELYFEARRFVNTYDLIDDKYLIYTEGDSGDTMVKMFCVDPSGNLSERIGMSRSCIFFSATLLPVQYYKDLLSAHPEGDYEMYVDSPFSPEKRLIFTAGDVSSRYSARNQEQYERIADYLSKIIKGRNGNYIAFFPSYAFMASVFDIFTEKEMMKAGRGLRVFCQESGMDEEQRQAFLDNFKEDAHETVLGFCVLGGIFSEGIDLKADRLIGAIIVGTGLPGIGSDRELLKEYFDKTKGRGFDYAYLYPGMNKVLQAGGRVIRSEEDTGIIALLDERFNYSGYQRLFPREWYPFQKVNMDSVEKKIEKFWTEQINHL